MSTAVPSHASDAFRVDAERVAGRMRGVFAAVIEAVCGGGARASEVADAFGVQRKLGWQVWNLAYDGEPLRAMRFVPSARSLQVWRAAAERQGVSGALLAQLDEVPTWFDALCQTHAPDRAMLEMMLETCEATLDDRAEERWRKQAFQGNSFIWGVRARTYLTMQVIHPSARAGFFDMVRVHGLIGLVRTRPNVRWPFAQAVVYSGDDERHPERLPIVPSETERRTGVPLLDAFCSRPTPDVQRREGQFGMLEDELLPGPMGQAGETTVVTGEVARELACAYRTQPGEDAMFGTGVRTPCETLILDHLVHRDLFPNVERTLRVYSELISPVSRDERDLLCVSECIQNLGPGIARLPTAEVPNYTALAGLLFERMAWKPEEFALFRVRMRYPPLPVAVMLQHDLPDPPGGLAAPDAARA
jgi:hypothetical protein